MKNKELIMVGLGLMGTSMVKALQEAINLRVVALDIQKTTIEKAMKERIIADGAVLGLEDEKARKLIRASRFIVLALYPDGIIEFLKKFNGCFQPGTIIMDICGLKGIFVSQAQELMPEGVEYIGTHPMAGKEKSGYDNGDGELFLGSSFIITPTEKNSPETVALIKNLAVVIGCGRVRLITPEEHDRMIAYTSHLPHIVATSLIQSWDGTEDVVSYAGGSFRDVTRVAEINSKLWTQLFCYNRKELLPELKKYISELETFAGLLEQQDVAAIESFLKRASDRKAAWRREKESDRYDGGHDFLEGTKGKESNSKVKL